MSCSALIIAVIERTGSTIGFFVQNLPEQRFEQITLFDGEQILLLGQKIESFQADSRYGLIVKVLIPETDRQSEAILNLKTVSRDANQAYCERIYPKSIRFA